MGADTKTKVNPASLALVDFSRFSCFEKHPNDCLSKRGTLSTTNIAPVGGYLEDQFAP